jgi:hypothetical protein
MNGSVPTNASAHATHDPAVVAALAVRQADLTDADRTAAGELVASCTECADLLVDLVALQVALPTASTPARPRDFSLTPDDADRLRARGWRRVLGFFGSARDSVSRPLAVGLTTLGLAGLLVASMPSFAGFGGATAGAPPSIGAAAPMEAAPAASSAASAAPSAAVPSAAAGEADGTDRVTVQGAPDASPFVQEGTFAGAEDAAANEQREAAGGAAASIRDDASGLSALFVVAGVMLIAGLGLFLLRWSARRLI